MSDPSRPIIAVPSGLGSLIAILVIIACLVLALMGKISVLVAVLIGAVALARLT